MLLRKSTSTMRTCPTRNGARRRIRFSGRSRTDGSRTSSRARPRRGKSGATRWARSTGAPTRRTSPSVNDLARHANVVPDSTPPPNDLFLKIVGAGLGLLVAGHALILAYSWLVDGV